MCVQTLSHKSQTCMNGKEGRFIIWHFHKKLVSLNPDMISKYLFEPASTCLVPAGTVTQGNHGVPMNFWCLHLFMWSSTLLYAYPACLFLGFWLGGSEKSSNSPETLSETAVTCSSPISKPLPQLSPCIVAIAEVRLDSGLSKEGLNEEPVAKSVQTHNITSISVFRQKIRRYELK